MMCVYVCVHVCLCVEPMCVYIYLYMHKLSREVYVIYNHVTSRWGVKWLLRRDNYFKL